jgi:hypothetical protein
MKIEIRQVSESASKASLRTHRVLIDKPHEKGGNDMVAESPARIRAPELHVTAKSDSEEFERLVEVADRGCIMMNTLRAELDVRVRAAVTA